MSKHDGGKGDAPRPLGVSMEQFDSNFDRIFGTAKYLKKNIKEVNAEFDKAYKAYKEHMKEGKQDGNNKDEMGDDHGGV
jgi:uncharacterized protein YdcH (DUF465 family)